jgi:ABC-2 type transport system permease protein
MEKKNGFFNNLLKSRSLRYGSNSILLIAIVVTIAVFANVLMGMADLKLDLTPNKLFSVGDTTKTVLKDLKKDVTIYGLFDDAKKPEYKEITELLKQYDKYDNVNVIYKDPDKNPGLIKDIDPNETKKISKDDFVIKSGNKLKIVSSYDLYDYQTDQQSYSQQKVGSKAEQAMTSGIKYVTADKTPTVYFTEGHDEGSLSDQYTMAKQFIEMNNFEVKTFNLLTGDKIPEDAQILVMLSPKRDISTEEADKLDAYLSNGGKAIFMVDPLDTNTKFTNLDKILTKNNLTLNYDKVKENDDSRRFSKDDLYSLVVGLQANSIMTDLDASKFVMAMPSSRSVNILKNQKEYITVTSLVKSSDKSEGELIDKSQGANLQGPLDLAVAVENKGGAKVSKIIVIGNSSFISDAVYNNVSPNGMLMFLYSVNWMQDQKDDTMIQPKEYVQQKLEMTAAQANVSAVMVIVIFPLLILGFGTFVWLRRRHL